MTEDGRGNRRLRKPKQLRMKEKTKRDFYKYFVRKKIRKLGTQAKNQKCGSVRGVLDTINETHAVNKLKGLIK